MANNNYARYAPGTYSNVPLGLVRALTQKKVGRNGWPVAVMLCSCVFSNRTLGRMPAATICECTGLTPYQVARGMTELRNKDIIVPVVRRTETGYRRIDRSNTGHVARYCFTPEVWEMIELETEASNEG